MKRTRLVTFCLTATLLVSCSKAQLVETIYTNYIDEINTKVDANNKYYYQKSEFDPISYSMYKGGEDKIISSYNDIYSDNNDAYTYTKINSTGEQKLLVVPVYFTDYDEGNRDIKHKLIQNAFFGSSDSTVYESVASFYNKSSYGHLKLSGTVTDWYNLGFSSRDFINNNEHQDKLKDVIDNVVEWLKSGGYSNPSFNIDDYDSDGDGYIDGIYLIYDYPYSGYETNSVSGGNNTSTFWAYTLRTRSKIVSGIKPNAFSWSSVNFAYGYNFDDVHVTSNTYIHEVGHLFGLSDYYNTYDNSKAHFQPTGFFDMMDYNIGDHTGLSKLLLNWVTPKVLKYSNEISEDNFEITLHPFSSSGDLLLIPTRDYNNTPYDEYLLLEYFTPNGLNRNDYIPKYQYIDKDQNTHIFTYPNQYGLKVYHVDARLAYLRDKTMESGKSVIAMFDDADKENKMLTYYENIYSKAPIVGFAYSNEISDATLNFNPTSPVLYHLLESSGNNTFKDGLSSSNNTLFKLNDSFGIDEFKDYSFNKKNKNNEQNYKMEYSFSVKTIKKDSVTIRFNKINNYE